MKDDEIRILILEDNPTDVELVEYELRKGGIVFQSKRVETRGDFISQIEQFTPQLILADYKLPAFDGMTAFSIIKEKGLEVPFIIVSGALGEVLAIETLKAGVTDYVLKNNLIRLVPAVNRALAESKLQNVRSQVEKELRESEKRFKAIADYTFTWESWVGNDGRLLWVNPAVERITGYSAQEVMSMEDFPEPLIMEEDRVKTLSEFKKAFQKQTSGENFEFRVRRKDGQDIWCAVDWHQIFDEKGKSIGLRTGIRDINELKQAEEALQLSEKRYRTLFDKAKSAILITQLLSEDKHKIVDCNVEALQLFGCNLEDIINKTPEDFSPAIQPKWNTFSRNKAIEFSLASKEVGPQSFEWVHCRLDGTSFWAEVHLNYVEIGSEKYIQALISDISERKRVEEALYRSEKEARRLAHENAIIAEIGRIISLTLDINEIYGLFAGEVHKLIPYDRIDITSNNFPDQTVIVDYVAGQEVLDRHAGDRFPFAGSLSEELARRRSGILIQSEEEKKWAKRFPVMVSMCREGIQSMLSIPLFSHDQVIGGFHLESLKPQAYTDEDLKLAEKVGNQIAGAIANAQLFAQHERLEAERMSLEEQLQQSQKMEAIGQLAGGVAHDFNNLLTVISVQSQLALRELRGGDPLKEKLKDIELAANRAANLTRQLLAFSRRQILEMKVVNLNIILKDLDKMLHRVVGEDIDFKTVFVDDLGLVKVDPGQMEQVVMNLVVNAKDAMPQGGKLFLETANVELDEVHIRSHSGMVPGAYVMLAVTDTGSGMSKEVKEQIFDPFFTTKEKGKGTGLGLSTVYGIIKQSGGDINVYSEPGKGTTFKIYLLRVFEREEKFKKVTIDENPRGGERILVVEDDRIVRRLAIDILREQGYRVLEAVAGWDALGICEKEKSPIDLILTDVVMPHMSGPELIERLRQVRNDFKVLYMTGYMDEAIIQHGVVEKTINLIHKPFTIEKLARKVRGVLDKNLKAAL